MLYSRKKPKGFDERMKRSIELLQKAEKLALKYDADDGYYLAFSGGKDSQALYHIATLAGVKFQAHMNFTSVDPPQVIRFVRKYYPDVITHAPEKSIYQLAIEKGILPSMKIRWCCDDLKESASAGKVTLIGIRKSESVRRSKRHEVEISNRKFSGDLDAFSEWQIKELEKREAKLRRKLKREGKKINEDEFSLRKDREVRCINGQDKILISPIFEWTVRDVWYFLNEVVKVPHCELYDMGYTRIGCILCPMSQHKQKILEMKDFPHVKQNWIKAIKAIRRGGGNLCRRIYLVEYPSQRTCTKSQWNAQKLGGWINNPDKKAWGIGIEKPTAAFGQGFLDSPSVKISTEGLNEEDVIAENIFDWWVSGKSYNRWYADKFMQLKIDFDEQSHLNDNVTLFDI